MTSAPNPADPAAPILVLCRDLMFASKIRSAAGPSALPVQLLRDPIQLIAADGAALIVDLNQDGAHDAAVSWKAAHPAARLLGFVAHTDTAMIERAKSSGFDQVVTRGQFSAAVISILANLSGRPTLPNAN